jgi:hypothetical protein
LNRVFPAAAVRVLSLLTIPGGAIVLAFAVGAVVLIASSPLVKGYVDLQLPIVTYTSLIQGSILSVNGLVDTLPAGQRCNVPLLGAAQADELERLGHALPSVGSADPGHLRPEPDVPRDVAVGKEHRVLEHEPDVASVGRQAGHVAAVEEHPAR